MFDTLIPKIRKLMAKMRTRTSFRYRQATFRVSPGVLNPTAFRASFIFARAALKYVPAHKSTTVLDLGCGMGLTSILLARLDYQVTAVDVDPEAVANTIANAEANEVSLTCLQSNWDENLGDTRYGFVISNPPFLVNKPGVMEGPLYAGPEMMVVKNCLAAIKRVLTEHGTAMILTSSLTGRNDFLNMVDEAELKVQHSKKTRGLNETLYIDLLEHAPIKEECRDGKTIAALQTTA